jgi:hypothetical protein
MSAKNSYDAGHFSFLELIRVLHSTAGPAFAKGALVRTGMGAAANTPVIRFDTFEQFLGSIDAAENPIAQFEGKARHYGDGLFGLPACPFARSIQTYTGVTGGLPKEYKEVTDEMNKPSAITAKLRVGQGAAVSPFCAVHQPIRSELGKRVEIGGKPLRVIQLGCKSGGGHKGLADPLIEEAGVAREKVDQILDENMCCYCVRIEEE